MLSRVLTALALAGLAAGAIVFAGLAPRVETMSGQVTTLSPRICVGRPEAAGDCFVAASNLDVGEILARRSGEAHALHERHMNPQFARVLDGRRAAQPPAHVQQDGDGGSGQGFGEGGARDER